MQHVFASVPLWPARMLQAQTRVASLATYPSVHLIRTRATPPARDKSRALMPVGPALLPPHVCKRASAGDELFMLRIGSCQGLIRDVTVSSLHQLALCCLARGSLKTGHHWGTADANMQVIRAQSRATISASAVW